MEMMQKLEIIRKRKSYGWKDLLNRFLQGSVQGDQSLQLHKRYLLSRREWFFFFISTKINKELVNKKHFVRNK